MSVVKGEQYIKANGLKFEVISAVDGVVTFHELHYLNPKKMGKNNS